MITGLRQKTFYGRPNWNDEFKKIAYNHPRWAKPLSFACQDPPKSPDKLSLGRKVNLQSELLILVQAKICTLENVTITVSYFRNHKPLFNCLTDSDNYRLCWKIFTLNLNLKMVFLKQHMPSKKILWAQLVSNYPTREFNSIQLYRVFSTSNRKAKSFLRQSRDLAWC